jgi:hypothetical protein
MHWVLVYFLTQQGFNSAAGGVGQIRFKTEPACQSFYKELEKRYKPKHVNVNGVCMQWHSGVEHRVEHKRW